MEETITLDMFKKSMLTSVSGHLDMLMKRKKRNIAFPQEKQEQAIELVFKISELYKLSPFDVASSKRSRELVFARCILTVELLRKYYTKTNIGVVLFHGHAAIVYSVKNHLKLIKTKNKEYQGCLGHYKNYLKEMGFDKISINDQPSGVSLFCYQ